MSYDLSFLRRSPGETWEEALATPAASEIAPELLAAWERIVDGLREVLGTIEVHVGDHCLELFDDSTGIQLTCYPGELSLTAPTPVDFRVLRLIAALVERETGFEGYDPQLDTSVTS